MKKATRADLIKYMQSMHAALEEITDINGCSFPQAKLLCDVENCLKAEIVQAKPAIVGTENVIH